MSQNSNIQPKNTHDFIFPPETPIHIIPGDGSGREVHTEGSPRIHGCSMGNNTPMTVRLEQKKSSSVSDESSRLGKHLALVRCLLKNYFRLRQEHRTVAKISISALSMMMTDAR